MRSALIVAMTREGLMGRDNALPWHWPEDLAHFKRTTRGHAVVMGRRTWESLRDNFGGPLPQRVNVVVSREHGGAAPDGVLREGVHWFAALADALSFAARSGQTPPPASLTPPAPPADAPGVPPIPGEIFILGGADIFRAALSGLHPPPRRLIVTWVPSVPARAGDTFFPFTPPEAWILQHSSAERTWSDSSGQLRFVVYERREAGSRVGG